MVTKGPEAFVRTLKRSCLSPESLELKQGAVMMFTKNDPAGRYVNGTLGVVDEFDAEDGYPVVRTRGGKRILAEPSKWKIEENGKERASITQVPVRLAWAMTVHKSQGMSLDAAVIDLSRAFEYGQGYVALSRLRSLSGLHLLGLNERALRVHPLAVEKDAEFRAASAAAPRPDAASVAEKQRDFVAAGAAKPAQGRRHGRACPGRRKAKRSTPCGRRTPRPMPHGRGTRTGILSAATRPGRESTQSPPSSAASPAPSAPGSRSSGCCRSGLWPRLEP
jgi:ATP-dependent DNA helicase PIF1